MYKKINKINFIFIIIGVVCFLFVGLFPVHGDFLLLSAAIKYFIKFKRIELILEPSFWLIVIVSTFISKFLIISPIRLLIIFYSILGVFLTLYAIRKISYFPILALIVYLCVSYYLHQFSMAREGLASAVFMLAIPDIVNKNFKSYLIKTVIATLFHYSAFIMIFAYFVNIKKTKIFEFLLYIFLPFIGMFLYLKGIGELIIIHILPYLPPFLSIKLIMYMKHKGLKHFDIHGITILGFMVIYYFFIFNFKKIKNPLDKVLVKLLGWLIFIFYTFAFLPVISGRMDTQFGFGAIIILLLPDLVFLIKQKKLAYALVVLYSILIFADIVIVHKIGSNPYNNLHFIFSYIKNGL